MLRGLYKIVSGSWRP